MRLKFLLRPGWLSLILVVAAFSAICFTVLAPWQFRRDDQREAQNEAVRASFTEPAKSLSQVLPGGSAPGPDTQWRKVVVTGHYLPAGETLARLRTVQGEAAFEVLTPFQPDDGPAVLVDRGYVRPVRGTAIPDYPPPPTGRVTIEARVQANEQDKQQRGAFQQGGHRQVYAIDSDTVARAVGTPMRPGYFQTVDGQPGGLNPLPLPRLESGPFFSYALQWIAFGIMAPLGVIYLAYRELYPVDESDEKLSSSVAATLAEDDPETDEAERRRIQGV